ncbi:MAG: globin family protein [Polaribacter sp.]|uniref:globin family protein n=1 Tax=Polaribacter sp. TaxID=1920175 RepID=UPI003263B18B
MEAKTITLVQESFKKVRPIADTAATIFYNKLFELDPELKPLFPSGEEAMKTQGNKLMTMLGAAVAGLSDLDALIPVLEGLGKKHVGYNVKESHYSTVGAALLATLEAGLGGDFTPEVKDAWAGVYQTMSSVMIGASY